MQARSGKSLGHVMRHGQSERARGAGHDWHRPQLCRGREGSGDLAQGTTPTRDCGQGEQTSAYITNGYQGKWIAVVPLL